MGARRHPFQEAGGKIVGEASAARLVQGAAKTAHKKAPVGEEVDGRFS